MRPLTFFCAALATLALALGFVSQSLWAWACISVAIGLLWLVGDWRGWDAVAGPCLAGWVGLAAFGAWWGVISGWMLIGLVAALAAWDLWHFGMRLRDAGVVAQAAELTRAHLRRLGIVVALGLLLGGIALGLRVELTFGWTLLVAALAVIAVSSVIRAGGNER